MVWSQTSPSAHGEIAAGLQPIAPPLELPPLELPPLVPPTTPVLPPLELPEELLEAAPPLPFAPPWLELL